MTRADFIATLAPQAVQARRDGSPLFPSVRLAQNALETGWIINKHNNLGGFKVGGGQPNEWWRGATYTTLTWEVINGRRIQTVATWRSYDSVYDFYRDQDRLFQSARYARVRAARTPDEQCEALYLCGYATDPAYADKLKTIIRTYGLTKYDEEAEEMTKEEKAAFDALFRRVTKLEQDNAALMKLYEASEKQRKMPCPDWARPAVEAAQKRKGPDGNPLVIDADGGSYDFYRLLSVMHRAGLL